MKHRCIPSLKRTMPRSSLLVESPDSRRLFNMLEVGSPHSFTVTSSDLIMYLDCFLRYMTNYWCHRDLFPISRWWFQSFFFNFHPYLGKIPILTSIFFQMGWFNHQPDMFVDPLITLPACETWCFSSGPRLSGYIIYPTDSGDDLLDSVQLWLLVDRFFSIPGWWDPMKVF